MGAWIETANLSHKKNGRLVAPYVGAWIETKMAPCFLPVALSHPTWVRGLKRSSRRASTGDMLSHPTWVRGLKQYDDVYDDGFLSRTLRGCVD